MTTAVLDSPAKPAAKARANAQTARAAAASTSESCPFCKRLGLPILPLRYAVIPTWITERAKPVLAGESKLDPRAPAGTLTAHRYALRTLRKGFVHVYLGTKGMWQIYAVTSDGLLRLLPNPDDPGAKADREMTAQCKREGHNIPASFIRIPEPYSQKTVWIAFSQDVWGKRVREAYELKPANRMQAVDCKALSANPDAHADAFEITASAGKLNQLVEEYAQDEAQAQRRRQYGVESKEKITLGLKQGASNGQISSVHGFYARPGQLEATGRFAADYEKQSTAHKKPGKVAALALHDPVGIAQELNHTRLLTVQWRADYVGNIAISRPKIISQAIMGLKTIYEQSALLSVASENGIAVVESEEAAKSPANKNKTTVTVDKLPEFAKKQTVEVEGMPDPATGMRTPSYTMTIAEIAERRAKGQWASLKRRYDEDGRAKFDKRYEAQMKAFQKDLETLGADYDAWARNPAWMMCFADYDSTVDEEAALLTQMAAPILSGGPTDTKSYALWQHWLGALTPNDKNNPVYVAYMGGRKTLVDYLLPNEMPQDFMNAAKRIAGQFGSSDPEAGAAAPPEIQKADKLYDSLKALYTSEESEHLQKSAAQTTRTMLAQSPAFQAATAHIQSAIAAATALLGNKLDAAKHATALRAHQAALYLYKNIQVAFVKVTLTLGQYLAALKAAGFDAAQAARQALQALRQGAVTVKDKAGREVRSLALAGMLSLNDSKLRDTLIEVTVWVAGKAKDLADYFKSLGAEVKAVAEAGGKLAGGVAKSVAISLRAAGITLSREASQIVSKAVRGAGVTAEHAALFARRLIGWGARMGGSKDIWLAGAALGFQNWAFLDANNQLKDKIGPEKAEAALAIVSAQVGMTAAGVEIFGAAFKALGFTWASVVLKVAGVVAAGASVVDAVSAFMSAARTYGKGDGDATFFYFIAGGFFAAGAGFGIYAAFGTASLLGPFGIALLLVVIGVGLMFAALLAEDTAAEIWLDRCYWGYGSREEDGKSAKWTDHDHATELAEMNSLILGAKAEIGFNHDHYFKSLNSNDTISMKVTLPHYDPKESAFVLVARAIQSGARGEPHLLYYEVKNKPIPPNLPRNAPNAALLWNQTEGSDTVDIETRKREIVQSFRVDRNVYDKVSLSLDYWPDATDESAVLSIKKLETD